MPKYTIHISEQFSKYPGGRYRTDGKYSGEAFRLDHLVPALEKHEKICIDMDNVLGYGSSFLDEAFGGLVRRHGFQPKDVLSRIEILSKDPSLRYEIEEHIKNQAPKDVK